MQKGYKILIIAALFISFVSVSIALKSKDKPIYISKESQTAIINNKPAVKNELASASNGFHAPLDRPQERVTKKPFGIFVTPKDSPIQPERFYGYHTGTDFEIFPDEINKDITVHAICNGKVEIKKWASGYGGVLVESCVLNNQPVTVIYGHLNAASLNQKTGDILNAGDSIGLLGKDKSTETDGERKHLHLGIHNGAAINIRGYVNNKSQLDEWLDPMDITQF